MKRTVAHGENSIRWKFTSKFDDLDFADDEVLSSTQGHRTTIFEKMSVRKTI